MVHVLTAACVFTHGTFIFSINWGGICQQTTFSIYACMTDIMTFIEECFDFDFVVILAYIVY